MTKFNIEQVLSTVGPSLSSDLAELLVTRYGLTPAAARKRISRGSPNIYKLSYIVFPHRARFIYLKKDYASNKFWQNLYSSLKKENSSYYMAIHAINKRGGMIKKSLFGIICGSPIRQKNHIPYQSILASLIKSEIIDEISSENGVKYLFLKEFEDEKNQLLDNQENKELVEGILTEQSRTWIKQLGLVSYGKSKALGDNEENPRVGTFEWYITGPSYLHPITSMSLKKSTPGFIACDLNTTNITTIDDVNCFIRKMEMTSALKKVGKCIFIYISRSYTKESLLLAKSKGIMALTFNNVFGIRNISSVDQISTLLEKEMNIEKRLNEIASLTNELKERNGITNNLKGRLFEHICAEIKRRTSPSTSIFIGREYKLIGGEVAEADVSIINEGIEITFIECKGIKRDSFLDEAEVDLWLDKRIPRILQFCKNHPSYASISKNFELWVTGELTELSLKKINDFSMKSKKFKITINGHKEILSLAKKTNDKPLKTVLFSYFLKRANV